MRVTRFCHATRVFASVDPRKAVDFGKEAVYIDCSFVLLN